MAETPLFLHYHQYSITKETFLKHPGLYENLKITQEGEWNEGLKT